MLILFFIYNPTLKYTLPKLQFPILPDILFRLKTETYSCLEKLQKPNYFYSGRCSFPFYSEYCQITKIDTILQMPLLL